jgi:hypothetical protein
MMNADPVLAYRTQLRSAASRRVAARRRRLLTVFALAIVGVLTASLSLAATTTGWLTAKPAPPEAVSGFQQYTPQLGFHPQAGGAQFVAEDGPVKLYVASNREGGLCYLVDEPWKPANAGDGGTCASKAKADEPLSAGMLGMSAVSDEGFATIVLAGRVRNPAARTLRFADPAGSTVERQIGAAGFYVAAVRARPLDFSPVVTPDGIRCPRGTWEPTFVALDPAGHVVLESKILLARSEACTSGGEGTPHGPYAQGR